MHRGRYIINGVYKTCQTSEARARLHIRTERLAHTRQGTAARAARAKCSLAGLTSTIQNLKTWKKLSWGLPDSSWLYLFTTPLGARKAKRRERRADQQGGDCKDPLTLTQWFRLNGPNNIALGNPCLCLMLRPKYILFWGVLPSAKRPEGRAARGRPSNVWQPCFTLWPISRCDPFHDPFQIAMPGGQALLLLPGCAAPQSSLCFSPIIVS